MVKTSQELDSFETDWEFAAPVGTVYRAFTRAEAFEQWSCGTLYDSIALDMDPREGGVLYQRVKAKRDGSVWTFFGVYLKVEEDAALSYTFDWKQDWREPSEPSLVELEFIEIGEKSKIHLVHSQLPKPATSSTEMHWRDFLAVLEGQMG